MLLTITIIVSCLILLNLILLKFSCNKTVKTEKIDRKPIVLKSNRVLVEMNENLAPTGS
jgi:hypothetical protein